VKTIGICKECGKEITGKPYKRGVNRHMLSPNTMLDKKGKKYFNIYCSEKCADKADKDRYRFFADIDENCSDCKHFKHDHWEKEMRIGSCKYHKHIKVEPLMPNNNSGQPKCNKFERRQ